MAFNRSHTERDPLPDTPRNIRLDAGFKLREVASLMGTTTGAVSRIETGRRNPTVASVASFYAACGRADLVQRLLPMLDDDRQSKVFDVLDRYAAKTHCNAPSVGPQV